MLYIFICLFYSMSGTGEIYKQPMDMGIILPSRVLQWHHAGKDQFFTRDNLYDYINGGAELYLSYGFNSLYNRVYESENAPDIIVDIFDMESSENAFGIFSHSREIIDSTFGQGSQYLSGLLLFWKDRFYISILASPETAESKKAVFLLARLIDENIEGKGKLPALMTVLPRENLIEQSVRFFRHHFWLNAHYFIADDNILLIDKKTDVILAKYGDDIRFPVCILIEYHTKPKADSARVNFAEHFLPELVKKSVTQFDDGSWCGIDQNDSRLAVILNASNKKSVNKILTALNWGE